MDPKLGYVSQNNKTSFSISKRMLVIASGLIAAIVIAVLLLVLSSGKSTDTQVQHLVVRMNNLQTLLSDQKVTRNIKSEELSNIVTSFSLTVTSDSRSLITALASDYPTKINDSVAVAEADTATAKTIEDAYLENKLDSVYADVLSKKIASIRALVAEIYGLSNNVELKKTLVDIDNHMHTTSDQLDALTL